jgi:hypothetical protein
VFAFQPNVGGFLDLAWLNKTNEVVVPIVENLVVEYVNIPQYNTTISSSIGEMTIKATNIRVASLNLDTAQSGFYTDETNLFGHFLVSNLNVTFGYDFKYSFFHYSGQGWADVTNVDARIGGSLGLNGETPELSIASHGLSIGGIKLHTELSSFL